MNDDICISRIFLCCDELNRLHDGSLITDVHVYVCVYSRILELQFRSHTHIIPEVRGDCHSGQLCVGLLLLDETNAAFLEVDYRMFV